MERSVLLFQNSVKSPETFERYMYYLKTFVQYYKLRDIDSITTIPKDKLQIMMEDYVMQFRTRNVARTTVSGPVNAFDSFLTINDIELNWKKIRKLLPAQGKKSGRHAWSTDQIRTMLAFAVDKRTKALIHFLASTGVRIGAIPQMRIKHLRNIQDGCKAVCVYADDKEEYWTFLTPEAVKALDQYFEKRQNDGEHLGPDSLVFRGSYTMGIAKPKPMKRAALAMIVYRVLFRSGIRLEKDGKRKDTQLDHGFRKRFNTIMKTTPGVKINIAEKMMGHFTSIPLDESYFDVTLDQLYQEFKKAIPTLTIDSAERLLVEKVRHENEKSELVKIAAEKDKINRDLKIAFKKIRESQTSAINEKNVLEMVKKALEQINKEKSV